jgi:hypothetical protein
MAGVEDPVLSGRCFLTETVKDWGQYLGQDPSDAGLLRRQPYTMIEDKQP